MTRNEPVGAHRPGILIDRRRFLLASLGGMAVVAVGSACGGSGSSAGGGSGRTVRLPQGATGFPSPFAANADIGYAQLSYVYDTLLCKDGTGQLLPWLAQSFTASPDNLKYTFQLRPNVKWSDGQPFTADDVVFTFDYFAKQQVLSPSVLMQPPQGIAKVSSSGSQTVEITLDSPRVTFLEQVAGALPIIPRHIWSSIGDPGSAQDTKVLVGTGAYRVASYNGDGGPLEYVARNDFFLGTPYIQRIQELAVNDPFAALLGNNTDYASGVGERADTLAEFHDSSVYGMVTNTGDSTNAMYWNLGKEGALSDVRFRQAMLMAIDQSDVITRIANGRGVAGNTGFLAPSNPYYSSVPQYSFDLSGANALLDSAGYPLASDGIRKDSSGNALSFGLLMDQNQAPLSEVLAADLKRAGIELKPDLVQIGPQLFGNKLTGQYDIAVLPFPGPGAGGPNADPDVLRLLFSSRVPPSLQGASDYANPTFDQLADQQLTTFDQSQRMTIVAQMQTILAQDLAVVPLYFPEWDGIYRRKVLDQWFFTPGQFPNAEDNKLLFITGLKSGETIRSASATP